MKSFAVITAIISAVVSLAGCSASPTPGEASSQHASAAHTSDPVADLSGTWGFNLDASEVARAVRDQCEGESAGDAAKKSACWKAIHEEAGREKIRFSKMADGGRATWTSFGVEGSKEVVFLELPLELVNEGQGHVLAKVVGKPSGAKADQFAKSNINQMRIEVVDAKTIAMTDPKKGRLVFDRE